MSGPASPWLAIAQAEGAYGQTPGRPSVQTATTGLCTLAGVAQGQGRALPSSHTLTAMRHITRLIGLACPTGASACQSSCTDQRTTSPLLTGLIGLLRTRTSAPAACTHACVRHPPGPDLNRTRLPPRTLCADQCTHKHCPKLGLAQRAFSGLNGPPSCDDEKASSGFVRHETGYETGHET